MSSNADPELERFVLNFFHANGAVVEKGPSHLEVLLPESLARELELPEHLKLAVRLDAAEASNGEETIVHYGSALLEKMIALATRQPKPAQCRLRFSYLKKEGFENLIREQFAFVGAKAHFESVAEVMGEYGAFDLLYTANSDEQTEGLFNLTFNLETGAVIPGFEKDLIGVDKSFINAGTRGPGPGFPTETLVEQLHAQASTALSQRLEAFKDRMNLRYRRDIANLEEYYTDLRREMIEGLERSGLSAQAAADRREKIALLPEELARKKNDLLKKYAIQVDLRLCNVLWIKTPVVKVLYRFHIGTERLTLPIYYNPVVKALEPLVCSRCGTSTFSICFSPARRPLCAQCRNLATAGDKTG